MKKIQYNGESKLLSGIATKINWLIDQVGTKIDASEKGVANGVATLDGGGKVPSSQLPSYVDDVVEGYYYNSNFYEDSAHTQLITPETSKIYVDLPTNKSYRWGGSEYVEISSGAVQSDWNQNDSSQLDYIKHKPTIPTALSQLTDDSTHRLVTDTEKATWNDNRAISKELTNESLDAITEPGFYYAGSGNTCSNKPSGVYDFGMIVLKTNTWGYSSVRQILISDSIAYGMEREKDGYDDWTDWYTCEGRTVDQSVIQDITDYAYPLLASPTPDNGEEITDEINAVKKTAGMFWHSRFKELEVREGSISAQTYNFNLLGTPNGSLSNPYGSDVSLPNHDGTLTTEKNAVLWKQQNVLGAKNLLPYPYRENTTTKNGITFTINADYSVTVSSGSPSANTNWYFRMKEAFLPSGKYIVSGFNDTAQGNAFCLRIVINQDMSDTRTYNDYGSGTEITVNDGDVVSIYLHMGTSGVSSGNKHYVMVRPSTVEDSTYQEPTMTNRQLTDKKTSWEQQNVLGAKNLLTFPYYHGFNLTANNVVFTVDDDGTITVGGTQASANTTFWLMYNETLPNGTYILSDGGVGTEDTYLSVRYYTTSSASAQYYDVGTKGSVTFTVDNWYRVDIRIWSRNGKTADNLVFKPMLRLSTIADDTFEPYAETNRQLTLNKVGWVMQNILGSKNLLPYPYINNIGVTSAGVTYTVDEKGWIHCSGTSTGNSIFTCSDKTVNGGMFLPNGNYRVSGCPEGGSSSSGNGAYQLIIDATISGATYTYCYETGDGAIFTVNGDDFSSDGAWVRVRCVCRKAVVSDSLVFKPMVMLASIKDNTYEPQANTNRQLTLNKIDKDLIAPTESGFNASQAYAVGDYMFWRRGFYRVTTAISQGGAITNGTNVTQTTLGAELKRALT